MLLQTVLSHVMLHRNVCNVRPGMTRVNQATQWGEAPVLQAGTPQLHYFIKRKPQESGLMVV